jgi:hypothetical protein
MRSGSCGVVETVVSWLVVCELPWSSYLAMKERRLSATAVDTRILSLTKFDLRSMNLLSLLHE